MSTKTIRLYYWLARAYFTKHSRFVFISFLITLGILAVYMYFLQNFISVFSSETKHIGVAGLYTGNRLPPEVISHITTPLLIRKPNGSYESKLLESWGHDPEYKTYTLRLKKGLTYTDGAEFTSGSIPFNFREVKVNTSDPYVIVYTLSKPFPNFLEYLTRPIYSSEPIRGIGGDYLISSIKLNQNQDQIDQIHLVPLTDSAPNITYRIYRSESDLITAFKLHEIDEFSTSNESAYQNFQEWPKTTAVKSSEYDQIVTIFFNVSHPLLKERAFREALYGSLPVSELERLGSIAVSPVSPFSPFYDKQLARIPENKEVNLAILKKFFKEASDSSTLRLSTTIDYLNVSSLVKDIVKSAGGDIILDVTGLKKGDTFDLLIGLWDIPSDSNQYYVWHSSQKDAGNITHYENIKVDRLLEDFRATGEAKLQEKYMRDFQTQFVRDLPANLLYYPHRYTITRKK